MLTILLIYGALIFIALRAGGLLMPAFKLLAIIIGLYAMALFSHAVHCSCLDVPPAWHPFPPPF